MVQITCRVTPTTLAKLEMLILDRQEEGSYIDRNKLVREIIETYLIREDVKKRIANFRKKRAKDYKEILAYTEKMAK